MKKIILITLLFFSQYSVSDVLIFEFSTIYDDWIITVKDSNSLPEINDISKSNALALANTKLPNIKRRNGHSQDSVLKVKSIEAKVFKSIYPYYLITYTVFQRGKDINIPAFCIILGDKTVLLPKHSTDV